RDMTRRLRSSATTMNFGQRAKEPSGSSSTNSAAPNLLNHLAAPSRLGFYWDRCGVHYVEPIEVAHLRDAPDNSAIGKARRNCPRSPRRMGGSLRSAFAFAG